MLTLIHWLPFGFDIGATRGITPIVLVSERSAKRGQCLENVLIVNMYHWLQYSYWKTKQIGLQIIRV